MAPEFDAVGSHAFSHNTSHFVEWQIFTFIDGL